MPRFIFTIVPQLSVDAPDLAHATAFINSLTFESGAVAIKGGGAIVVPGSGPKRRKLDMACVRIQQLVEEPEGEPEAPPIIQSSNGGSPT